jgi:CheY-like chemotaxis protein
VRVVVNDQVGQLQPLLSRLLGDCVTLRLELRPSLGEVCIDPNQLDRVLVNLATNARDAMPQGGRIEIHTEVIELDEPTGSSGLAPGVHVRLSVEDTGEGMPEDVQRHLFEPFFTTKPPGEGTGLGLSTVYGIVKGAGGHIDIQSEIGRGTRFDIFLPVAEDPGEVTENGEPDSITRGRGEVVLVVEDEDAVRETLADTLLQGDYRVLCASTGVQALELLERYDGKVDLLVTDVVMPGMSGPALVERMSHQWPSVRVLYMSGYIEDKLSRYRRLARAKTPLLQKPVEPGELTRRVRQVLDGTDR